MLKITKMVFVRLRGDLCGLSRRSRRTYFYTIRDREVHK